MEEDPEFDIDEDNLVYPRIESIYSDVNIKSEPIEISEDEFEIVEMLDSPDDYYTEIPNKIILGSKPSTQFDTDSVAGPSTASESWEDLENIFKCGECNLFFPTQNELDSHNTSEHSFLVARPMSRVLNTEREASGSSISSHSIYENSSLQTGSTGRRQKAVKSTAKSALKNATPLLHKSLNNTFNNPYGGIDTVSERNDKNDTSETLLCKHCNVRFPNEIALIKHTYELLPENIYKCHVCEKKFDSNIGLKLHRVKHYNETEKNIDSNVGLKVSRVKRYEETVESVPPDINTTFLQCVYCSCLQKYPGSMKRHLIKNHKVTEYVSKPIKFKSKCAICFRFISNYRLYNKHILKCHRKEFLSKTLVRFDISVKMRCLLCNHIFMSRQSAYKHKSRKHPGNAHKDIFVYEKPIKEIPPNPHPTKAKHKTSKRLLKYDLIPKKTLFKCNKCQIYFVSCSAALAHSKRCSLAKGDWKCNKCRRTFTNVERYAHTQQHQFTEKFKVYKVSDMIISKVLCVCPKCEVHFDEIALSNHNSADCIPNNGVECKICNLKIHSNSFVKHVKIHKKYNFSSDDFILVTFVDLSSLIASPKQEKEVKNPNKKQDLLYCEICKCHCYLTKKRNYHIGGYCKSLSRRCCQICGLGFSAKPFLKHIKIDHETNNLKLDDFTIRRIHDLKTINPVMPDFFQCHQCEVNSVSPLIKKQHDCAKEVFYKCPQCSQKYDSNTYNIHLAFHDYNHNRLKINESSIATLKFYSCVACNYGFQTYDGIVEHCQNHYINSQRLTTTRPCKLCKLNYSEDHESLHFNGLKFEIFKFDYNKLLTDDWINGFASLPKQVVEDILSRSIYAVLRNVRLELLLDGPTERTLYKCAQCDLNFEVDNVVIHATDSCSKNPRMKCGSCSATFGTRDAKNKHANVHVVYGDDIPFREIVFNKEDDKKINAALRTGKRNESLKFRKCQQCELLIKKSEYEAHITAHSKKVEIKLITCCRNQEILSYKLFKPINAPRKLHTVYKCRLCAASVLRKLSIAGHKCGSTYKKCDKCSLYILPCTLKKHSILHTTNKKFVAKNISVIEFEVVNNGKNNKKRRRYSSDDDAEAGSRVTIAVPKTYETRKLSRKQTNNSDDDLKDCEPKDASLASNAYAKNYIKNAYSEIADKQSEECENKSINNSTIDEEEQSALSMDVAQWRVEMRNKFYQCDKCYLFFVNRNLLLNHLQKCDEVNMSETPLICNRCSIVFHPSLVSFHEKLHELVNQNPIENYIYIINVTTNGVNVNDKKRWLYKCKLCNLHYLSTRTLELHFSSNHNVQEYFNCDTCDLGFTLRSRTKHKRIQHTEHKLSKDDIHIEITQKSIVNMGKIQLKAFNNTQLQDEKNVEIIAIDDGLSESEDKTKSDESIVDRSDDISIRYSDTGDSPILPVEEKIMKTPVDHNLYKCFTCCKHFLAEYTLVRHQSSGLHKGIAISCNICGLTFGKRTLEVHKRLQHGKLKLGLKDFVVANLKDSLNVRDIHDQEMCESESLNDIEKQNEVIDAGRNPDQTQNENDGIPEKCEDISKELRLDKGPTGNHIYKCVKCAIYFTNRRTLLLHIVVRKHLQVKNEKCDACGLVFSSGSLKIHQREQHEKLKLTLNDFVITDVFGLRIFNDENKDECSFTNNSILGADSHPQMDLEGMIRFENKGINERKDMIIVRLYECMRCKVCVEKAQRNLHVCCSDIQKKHCICCSLSFRNTDIIHHNRLHRKYRELSRKNFVINRFGHLMSRDNRIYRCETCSTHFVNLSTLEWHMGVCNHQTKRGYCEKCRLFFGKNCLSRHIYIHHTKMNLTVQQFKIICVSDNDKNLSNIQSVEMVTNNLNNSVTKTLSDRNMSQNVNIIKKIFKCGECDVYFLTRASYYHHVYKHRKLVATEFVDCNICDLQFLNESLGMHMKSHKDKSFVLDKLLIEEYQPNTTDALGINTYFAKDSFNSKLVSTTTHFDNDDITDSKQIDEQMSIIDSTSEESPKTTDGDIVSSVEDNDIYLRNSGTSDESPLNQHDEMTIMDVSFNTTE